MRDSRAIQTFACLTIFGSAAAIFYSTSGGFLPGIDRVAYEATGIVVAQQALQLLKPGGHLVVIARDTTAFKNPASSIQFASFRRELSRVSKVIPTVHSLDIDPLRPIEVPSGEFLDLLRKTAPGDVIVSFMGPPLLTQAQCDQLARGKPAVVAFCSGSLADQVDLRSLFELGLLQAAVIPKRNAKTGTPQPGSLRECFDRSYLIITSSNLAMLSPSTP